MSAKVYYHIVSDQLVIVWPVWRREEENIFGSNWSFCVAGEYYVSSGYALEGPHYTLLVEDRYIIENMVEVGEF